MDFGVYKQPAARARSSEPHPQRKHTGLSLRDELEEQRMENEHLKEQLNQQ